MTLSEINELTINAYTKTAEKYHRNFRNEIQEKEYDRFILDKFSKLIGNNGLICDVGCGPSGQIGEYLLKKNHKIIGIDLVPKCIEIAKNYISEIDFKVMDMMNTDFKDNEFDGIISFYSIIHTPKNKIGQLISEMNRILKINGKLLIVVKKGSQDGILDNEWYEGKQIHFTKFMEGELEKFFNDNNFTIDFSETRVPYANEINDERIYLMGTKRANV